MTFRENDVAPQFWDRPALKFICCFEDSIPQLQILKIRNNYEYIVFIVFHLILINQQIHLLQKKE